MTLTVLRRTAGQVFGGLSFSCDQSAVLLIIRLGSYILGRNTTEVQYHFIHTVSRVPTIGLTYPYWCWQWSPGWGGIYQVSPGSLCPPSFHIVLWKEVTMQPWGLLLKNWKPHSFRAEYLHKLFKIFSHGRFVSSPLIIYPVIYLYKYGWMDIYALDVGQAVLHCPFLCPNCSIFGPSFCVTLTYPLCIFLKCFLTMWQAPAHLVYFLPQL